MEAGAEELLSITAIPGGISYRKHGPGAHAREGNVFAVHIHLNLGSKGQHVLVSQNIEQITFEFT